MAQQVINNGETGLVVRTKINENFGELYAADSALAASGGAGLVGFLPSGTGADPTTVQAKLRQRVTPLDYGAVSNGTTNDSTAFNNAVAAGSNVSAGAGQFSAIRDVALSNHDSYDGGGSLLTAATGGTNLFTLSGFNPRVSDVYLSSSTALSGASFQIRQSRFAAIRGVDAVNGGASFVNITPATPASQVIAMPRVLDSTVEDITGTAITIGSSVAEGFFDNLRLAGVLVASTGGDRPSFTSTGWRQNTPVTGGFAVGGHYVSNVTAITFNRGFHLTDAQLTKFTNCIADSTADYGVLVDGASQKIKFADLFVGTTRGIKVAGTSEVWIDGLETYFNGFIPPWGSTDFFNGVTTFYDVEVRDTARLRISNWRGEKRIIVDSGATLIIDGGTQYNFRSVNAVGAATTTFLCELGDNPTEATTIWRAPCPGHIVRVYAASTVAPGAGQTFTYTVRKNFADTTLVATTSGGSTFSSNAWCGVNPIPVTTGDQLALKLVVSASAAATRHQGFFLFLPE